ncbi:hypothetical protein [Streptomyces sp. NPDC045369]|uniref:hypothetical protein n=1 Tax=Streptomyces sp. NPDC045369 TaxID=3155732 RepID=UPI0033E65769
MTEQEAGAARRAIEQLEKVGRLVTRSLLVLGIGALVFTCVNITTFAVKHHVPGWVAWMLAPLASLALLTVLYVDGVLAEQGDYRASAWPFVLRWFAGMSSWIMNCWQSLYADGVFRIIPEQADAGGLLLHSVAPFLLIILAEASAGYRTYLAAKAVAHRGTIRAWGGKTLVPSTVPPVSGARRKSGSEPKQPNVSRLWKRLAPCGSRTSVRRNARRASTPRAWLVRLNKQKSRKLASWPASSRSKKNAPRGEKRSGCASRRTSRQRNGIVLLSARPCAPGRELRRGPLKRPSA